jgi:hypothetical protein
VDEVPGAGQHQQRSGHQNCTHPTTTTAVKERKRRRSKKRKRGKSDKEGGEGVLRQEMEGKRVRNCSDTRAVHRPHVLRLPL